MIVDEVIAYAGDGTSPVAGGPWKRSLSKEYKKVKVAQGGNPYADMILEGKMLTALECVEAAGGMLELRISGAQAAKADGHNNHSGASELPERRFIPKAGETFKRPILDEIRRIAREMAEGG